MIAALRGTLEAVSGEIALIAVGGVVFQVQVTRRAVESFGGVGSAVFVPTHLHLREDMVALYGFADDSERLLFQKLISVTGVGPRLAIAVLSTLDPRRLSQAVASDDATTLSLVPGVGKRLASRIVLELKGKLGEGADFAAVPRAGGALDAVRSGLERLGYTAAEIQAALAALPAGADADVSGAIMACLRYLSERPRGRA